MGGSLFLFFPNTVYETGSTPFASLREAVDGLLIGTAVELPANSRHAALLARGLLEYKVSVLGVHKSRWAPSELFMRGILQMKAASAGADPMTKSSNP